MKDLQRAIEEILDAHDFITGKGMGRFDIDGAVEELTQLITSREQEIREGAIRWTVEQLKQLYFDDVESALEYLAQQKENK